MTTRRHQLGLFGLDALIDRACDVLREYEPNDQPYWGAFSGGKDSVVIKEVTRLAGVNVEWHYNVTTIDPPELVRFIRDAHPDVRWVHPKQNFFTMMERRGFPTRVARWCCAEFKEMSCPAGRPMILGIRAEESPRRAKEWGTVTFHRRSKAWAISPILEWTLNEVWAFIRSRDLPYCSLYDEGFERLGCIGCPMARETGRLAEFARWPRYERLWQQAFRRVWERRTGSVHPSGRSWFGDVYFQTWREMWEWWLSDAALPGKGDEEGSCQMALDMFSGGNE